MTLNKILAQTSNFFSKLILVRSWFLVTISIVAVLIATLYPFDFALVDNLSIKKIVSRFDNASYLKDIVNNILLFIPLGFSYTALLQKKKMKLISNFFALVLVSAGLSLTVEILQIFLDSRSPTPADVVNNTLGGIVGMTCFYIWHSKSLIYIFSSLEKSMARNYAPKIALLVFGYILLSFLILIPWQSTISLSNWNLNYPLLLGNEKNGERPWQGYVSDVKIADRAVSENEILGLFDAQNHLKTLGDSLVGSYQLTDGKSYQDSSGQLPKLLPQGQSSNVVDVKGIALSSSYWLKTETPTTLLSKRIQKTSQFTIITTVATADTIQTGPARIISLSSNNLHRNFTLGQQEDNLNLRIRTPITGENAADIILNAPGVFANTSSHNIVVTYAQANLKVYVDNLQNYYYFNLLELIPKPQKILYYVMTFVPLSIYLTLLTILAKKKFKFYRFLLLNGIILPSVILETILVTCLDKNLSIANILVGILLTGSTMLILKLRTSTLVRETVVE
jgi:glycopeptide antibiotics resistance protein